MKISQSFLLKPRLLSWWVWLWVGVMILIGFLIFFRTYIGLTVGNYFFGEGKYYSTEIADIAYAWAGFKQAPVQYLAYQRGRIAFIEGRHNQAIWFFDKELEFFPGSDQSYYMLGLTYGFMHREFNGIEAFEVFIGRHPDNWPARNDLAWLYFRIGALEEAYRVILPAAQMYAGTPWVENTYGVILLNQGKKKEAHEAFLRGLETLNEMSEEDWGIAYPGNNPEVYGQGLEEMKESFRKNIKLAGE